jgi:hypothetical protein
LAAEIEFLAGIVEKSVGAVRVLVDRREEGGLLLLRLSSCRLSETSKETARRRLSGLLADRAKETSRRRLTLTKSAK